MSSARDAMNRRASVASVSSRSGSSRISRIAPPTGVPPGSRSARHGNPATDSRSARRFSWVVLPAPSCPSNTISFPVVICSGQGDDRARRARLHSVHDPLIHAQHRLVEILLRRNRALIDRPRLDLLEQRVQLLLHFRCRLLSALYKLLRFAAQSFHLLEQRYGVTVFVKPFAGSLERLILRALADQPAELLRFFLEHDFSVIRSGTAGEYEPLTAAQVQEHLDVGIAAVDSDHLRDQPSAAQVDFERKNSSPPEVAGRLADDAARRRQSIVGAKQCDAWLPVAHGCRECRTLCIRDVWWIRDNHIELASLEGREERPMKKLNSGPQYAFERRTVSFRDRQRAAGDVRADN